MTASGSHRLVEFDPDSSNQRTELSRLPARYNGESLASDDTVLRSQLRWFSPIEVLSVVINEVGALRFPSG